MAKFGERKRDKIKHARQDYERFQDPALLSPENFPGVNPIPQDEPVFLLRGQDKHWSAMMEKYAELIRDERIEMETELGYAKMEDIDLPNYVSGSDELFELEKVIVHHARLGRLWPKKKTPDLPK